LLRYKLKNSLQYLNNLMINDRSYTLKRYKRKFGNYPNLDDPQTYNEKLNALKISDECYHLAKYVDKYEVRKFVSETIGEDFLVPLINIYTEFTQKIFDSLPSSFILKGTHGSAMNYLVRDKNEVQYRDIEKHVLKWLSRNFYLHGREKAYRFLQKRMIAEELMLENGESPADYKFYCFNGEPFFLSAIYSRYSDYSKNLYDMNGNLLPYTLNGVPNRQGNKLEIDPKDFLEVVRKLAAPFTFVRVDMYSYQGRPKFGELTFTPYNGMGHFNPGQFDHTLGEKFKINEKKSFLKDHPSSL
jgi:hypothetical protein